MLTRRAFMSRPELVERPPEEGSTGWLVAELDMYTSIIVRRCFAHKYGSVPGT